jgi:hypothetical protein
MTAREETFRKFVEKLTETTGKSLAQWKTHIRKNGPPKYRERVAWLQTGHGLKYRPACMLALQAGDAAVDYSDGAGLVDAMYAGPKAALRPVYDRLVQLGRELGPDVTESACKTFVSLKRKYVFLQIKPLAARIDLGLALPPVKTSARLIPTGGLEKGDRIACRIPISSIAEIDAWVIQSMKTAYERTPAGR